jgi:hypothetical protein
LSEFTRVSSFSFEGNYFAKWQVVENQVPPLGTKSEIVMKPLFASILALMAANSVCAHTVESAIVAAMSLSEAPNYSWICTVTDDAQAYDIEGKTRDGFTWQRQPMPKVIARRLGRDAGRELDSIFSSPFQYVIHTDTGWRMLEELPKQHRDWSDGEWYFVSLPVVRSPDMPADATDMGLFGLPPAIYIPVISDDEEGRVYTNAQFALALPHDELAIIVSSHLDFNVEDGVVSGTLTDLGAQLLLVHDGHEYITPVTAGGRFKLWLGPEAVEKFVVELAGIVVVDRKPIYVRQKSVTVVRDIGTTNLEIPLDARRRL